MRVSTPRRDTVHSGARRSQALKSEEVMGDFVLNSACLNKKPERWTRRRACCPDKQQTSGPLPLCETQAWEASARPNRGLLWVTYSMMGQGEPFTWECYRFMPSPLQPNVSHGWGWTFPYRASLSTWSDAYNSLCKCVYTGVYMASVLYFNVFKIVFKVLSHSLTQNCTMKTMNHEFICHLLN